MSGGSRLARGAREKAHRLLKEVPRLTFQNIKVRIANIDKLQKLRNRRIIFSCQGLPRVPGIELGEKKERLYGHKGYDRGKTDAYLKLHL